MSRTVVKPWVLDWPCDVTGVDPAVLTQASESATTWLWALSGRRVGSMTTVEDRYRGPNECTACVAPVKDSDGEWQNVSDTTDCCRLRLELRPVRSVTEVRLGGEVLDPAGYVLEGDTLVRLGACWPCDDDCEAAPIEVDYEWGIVPDGMALAAAGEVACEFVKGISGDNCRLPSRAVSISRQGVSIEMQDAEAFAENGLTGLPIADAWIRTMNPNRLASRSRVVSVDSARSV